MNSIQVIAVKPEDRRIIRVDSPIDFRARLAIIFLRWMSIHKGGRVEISGGAIKKPESAESTQAGVVFSFIDAPPIGNDGDDTFPTVIPLTSDECRTAADKFADVMIVNPPPDAETLDLFSDLIMMLRKASQDADESLIADAKEDIA